ncbi:MAG: ATP-dependent RNA helicase HrpA [Chitinivibrionales bacterium]|nr:ATP-dependent RNA helicase HrpA [Chitinivibrionales bacterium]
MVAPQQAAPMTLHLPIHEKHAEITDTIRANQVTVIAGETGSGKTTHLPLFCREAGRGARGRIACTQPRRVAAVSIARYVASLMGEDAGGQVGYRVRFTDKVSDDSRIVFMTDGILLNDIARDPMLREYDTIIIDEAHERSVTIDFLLGYLRTLLPRRPDLKLIIASATLDTGLFSRAFRHAPVITVSGRCYPVEIRYQPMLELWGGQAMESYLDGVITVVRELVQQQPEGDILIFLPTIQDIQDTIPPLQRLATTGDDRVLPLHSRLRVEDQQRVFERCRGRTIIVATNIAETSITVPGIRFVVDVGLARTLRYEHTLGATRMPIERIAQSSADQRAGRCGRVRDGVCIRLFSEQDYLSRPRFATPEIKRSNLAGVILRMAWLRLGKPEKFPFLQRPTPRALAAAWRQLRALGAVDHRGAITALGRQMARLPLDPPVARMLLYAKHERAVREVAIIAAALSASDPRLGAADANGTGGRAERFSAYQSDFMTFVTIWDALHRGIDRTDSGAVRTPPRRRVARFCERHGLSLSRVREWIAVHRQIDHILRRIGGFRRNPEPASYEAVHKSLLSGLAANIAQHEGNGLYRGVREHDIAIFPGSSLYGKQPRWILFHEIVETKRVYGRTAASIHPRWVEELFGDRCTYSWHDSHYDDASGTVRAREEVTFDGFTLVRNRHFDLATKDRARAHEVFVREALVEERAGDSWRFIAHNRALRERIDLAERKLRTRSLYAGDSMLEELYSERLPDVCSTAELSRAIAREGNDGFLCANESDLLAAPVPSCIDELPDTIVIADMRLRCDWRFAPAEPDDGMTIHVPEAVYGDVPVELWAWLVPSLTRRRVARLVEVMSKLVGETPEDPAELVQEILDNLTPGAVPFMESLREVASEKMGLVIEDEILAPNLFPPHLWPRIVVTGDKAVIRDVFWAGIEAPTLPPPTAGMRASRWAPWCTACEHDGALTWNFGRIPETAVLQPPGQLVAFTVYPALHREREHVAVRVFWSRASAAIAHATAVRFLLENALAEELAWSMRATEAPAELVKQTHEFTSPKELERTLTRLTLERVLRLPAEVPRDDAGFRALVASAVEKIPLASEQALGLVSAVADGYAHCTGKLNKMIDRFPHSPMFQSVIETLYDSFERYIGMLFDKSLSPRFLDGLPRYLLAFEGRIETAFLNPRRYRTVMADIGAFRDTLAKLLARPDARVPSRREELECYAQWIEELAVAQFGRSKVKPLVSITPEGLAARGRELLGTVGGSGE